MSNKASLSLQLVILKKKRKEYLLSFRSEGDRVIKKIVGVYVACGAYNRTYTSLHVISIA